MMRGEFHACKEDLMKNFRRYAPYTAENSRVEERRTEYFKNRKMEDAFRKRHLRQSGLSESDKDTRQIPVRLKRPFHH